MKKAVLVIGLALLCALGTAAQTSQPQPIKPSAEYLKHLHRYQDIQNKKAADQRVFDAKHLAGDIEAAGLSAYLSRTCSTPGQTDCVPGGYGVNPSIDGGMFVPLPELPKVEPEKPKPAEPEKPAEPKS